MKFDRLLNHDDLTEIQYKHFQNSLEFHKIIKARKFLYNDGTSDMQILKHHLQRVIFKKISGVTYHHYHLFIKGTKIHREIILPSGKRESTLVNKEITDKNIDGLTKIWVPLSIMPLSELYHLWTVTLNK